MNVENQSYEFHEEIKPLLREVVTIEVDGRVFKSAKIVTGLDCYVAKVGELSHYLKTGSGITIRSGSTKITL